MGKRCISLPCVFSSLCDSLQQGDGPSTLGARLLFLVGKTKGCKEQWTPQRAEYNEETFLGENKRNYVHQGHCLTLDGGDMMLRDGEGPASFKSYSTEDTGQEPGEGCTV